MNSNSQTQIILKSYLLALVFAVVVMTSFWVYQMVRADGASTSVDVGNANPSVAAVNISPDPIILTENATTSVTITATITDSNGCDDVFASGSISAVLYRSGVGASCSADDNNCYTNITLVEVGNTCTGGADTSGDAVGTSSVFWFAEPTDASSTFAAQTWDAQVKAIDFSNGSSTATDASPPELNSLYALDVTASISYGAFAPNASSTSAENQTATTTNTGNFKIDIEFSGTNMTSGGDTLNATEQRYGTSTANHADLSFQLTTSAVCRDINVGKATVSSTPSASSTFWGINIPSGQASGTYTGTDTFTAVFGDSAGCL